MKPSTTVPSPRSSSTSAVKLVAQHVTEPQRGALFGEPARHRGADPPRRAADQRDLAVQSPPRNLFPRARHQHLRVILRHVVENDVRGRVVIVTGTSRGIGRGIARYLAKAGASVVVTGRKVERLEAVADELRELGTDPLAIAGNVADRDACLELAARTVERFGRIDGLVANAQSFRPVTPLEDVTAS